LFQERYNVRPETNGSFFFSVLKPAEIKNQIRRVITQLAGLLLTFYPRTRSFLSISSCLPRKYILGSLSLKKGSALGLGKQVQSGVSAQRGFSFPNLYPESPEAAMFFIG